MKEPRHCTLLFYFLLDFFCFLVYSDHAYQPTLWYGHHRDNPTQRMHLNPDHFFFALPIVSEIQSADQRRFASTVRAINSDLNIFLNVLRSAREHRFFILRKKFHRCTVSRIQSTDQCRFASTQQAERSDVSPFCLVGFLYRCINVYMYIRFYVRSGKSGRVNSFVLFTRLLKSLTEEACPIRHALPFVFSFNI